MPPTSVCIVQTASTHTLADSRATLMAKPRRVAEVEAAREEPRHVQTSESTVSSHLLQDVRRQQRQAWARGRSSWLPTHGRGGVGLRGWSVNVAVVDRARTLRGWTQRELSRHARVDPGTLSDLLAQRCRPTFGTVQAICASLNLVLAEVIDFHSDVE